MFEKNSPKVSPVAPKSSIAVRREHAAESFKTASECIGTLVKGSGIFALTRGQFSMIDAILACLDQTGPAHVSVWTWTVAEYEVAALSRLMRDERLLSGRMVIDGGARNKNAGIISDWKQSFGQDSVRYVVNHAKIALIENNNWKLLLRGSMNLNFNPRFEQFDLTEGGADFELVREIKNELPILMDSASTGETYSATKLEQAFDAKTLDLFGGTKVWAK
jgi:hypothetical protein